MRYLRWSAGAPEMAVRILNYRSNGRRLRDSISWGSVLSLAKSKNASPEGRRADAPSPVPSGFLDLSFAQANEHKLATRSSYSSEGLEELIDLAPPVDDVPVRKPQEQPSAGMRLLRDAVHELDVAEKKGKDSRTLQRKEDLSEPQITLHHRSYSVATSSVNDATRI